MKRLCVFAAFGAIAFVSAPAQAQQSVTLFTVCMTHYGDNERPNDVTPVARVTWPSNQGTVLQINSAYFSVMLERGVRFYKAQCWGGDSAERVVGAMNQWEEMSGYAKRPRREQALNDIFPAMFDQSFRTLSSSSRGLSRSDYSAVAVDSAVDSAANAKVERERERERASADARARSGPPQQLEITASPASTGPTAAELRAQRHAGVEARNAAALKQYQDELARQQQAVAEFDAANDRVAAEKSAQAARVQAVQEEYQRQQAAHAAEIERQRAEYREQYKAATGSYPSD